MRNFLFLLILSFSFLNCHKDTCDNTFLNATLLHFDQRECVCCGGVFVHFDDPALNNKDENYQWLQISTDFGIDEHTKFPVAVRIRYHLVSGACAASKGIIDITELVKR